MAWPFGKKEKKLSLRQEEKFEKHGISTVGTQQVENRVNIIYEISQILHRPLIGETPIKRMLELREKIDQIDTLLETACFPFLGAGRPRKDSREDYSRPLGGYFAQRRFTLDDWLVKYADMRDKDKFSQRQIEERFQMWPLGWFFEDAFYLAQHTFTPEQVVLTNDRAMVVHTQPNMGWSYGGGVAPTSGGRTSSEPLPPRRKYPQTLDNTVEGESEEE